MSRKSSLIALREQYEKVLENLYTDEDESVNSDMDMSSAEPTSVQTSETHPTPEPSLQPIGSNDYEEEEEIKEIEFVAPKQDIPLQKANCVKCGVCHDENEECEEDDNGNLEMAESELFKIMSYVKNINECLKSSKKMEAWMLSKLIKAADYLCSVNGVLQYDAFKKEVQEPAEDFSNDMHLVSQITNMLNGEGRAVNEEVLKRTIFNLEIIKANEQIS